MATTKKTPTKAKTQKKPKKNQPGSRAVKAPAKKAATPKRRGTSVSFEDALADALPKATKANNPAKTKAVSATTRKGRPGVDNGIDWDAIERDYRTGRYTNGELAKMHGTARETIQRRASKEGWKQDLKDAVRRATSALVVEQASQKGLQNVTETVMAAAELGKQVILSHRQDIRALRDETASMLQELRVAPENASKIEDILTRIKEIEHEATLDGETPEKRDKRLSRLRDELAKVRQQVWSMADIHSRIGSANRLADAMVKLQTLERKAFNLDDKEDDKKGLYESILDEALQ